MRVTRDTTFEWNGETLAGTLHLPDEEAAGDGRHPTVLLLQGSGPSDRDSNGFFGPIRTAFLGRGIATYAFDKPGCGASTGDWRRHGLDARADQAVAALDALRTDAGVDADRLGIFGHSQGGWLVQMLAARLPHLAFAIANSAPSIGVAEQDLHGCEHTLRRQGFDEADIAAAVSFTTALHEAARRDESFARVEAELLPTAVGRPWYGYLTVDDEDDWAMTRIWATEPYDPIEALGAIGCPFLAVYGALDPLLPRWRSAKDTSKALLEAAAGDATVVVMPAGNHRIQHDDTDEFVDGYLDLIGDWAARRAHRRIG